MIPIYNQWDSKWSHKQIGNSTHTMGPKGCYVTSLTMMLHAYGIHLDPGEVVDKLNAVNGFTPGGLMTYSGVERAFPRVHFHERAYTMNDSTATNFVRMTAESAIDRVKHRISIGFPTILCVDNVGQDKIPDHAVLGVKTVGEDIQIHDPAGGRNILFSEKYGSLLENLYGYVSIIGPPATLDPTQYNVKMGNAAWKAKEMNRAWVQGDMDKVITYAREIDDTLL